jgi:hypothetical protein
VLTSLPTSLPCISLSITLLSVTSWCLFPAPRLPHPTPPHRGDAPIKEVVVADCGQIE